MTISKNLNENLIKIKDLIKHEKNLAIDLINVSGFEGVIISNKFVDLDIIKFVKSYFGDVRGFENVSFTESATTENKLRLEKSVDLKDINFYLNSGMAIFLLEGNTNIYGISTNYENIVSFNGGFY